MRVCLTIKTQMPIESKRFNLGGVRDAIILALTKLGFISTTVEISKEWYIENCVCCDEDGYTNKVVPGTGLHYSVCSKCFPHISVYASMQTGMSNKSRTQAIGKKPDNFSFLVGKELTVRYRVECGLHKP